MKAQLKLFIVLLMCGVLGSFRFSHTDSKPFQHLLSTKLYIAWHSTGDTNEQHGSKDYIIIKPNNVWVHHSTNSTIEGKWTYNSTRQILELNKGRFGTYILQSCTKDKMILVSNNEYLALTSSQSKCH